MGYFIASLIIAFLVAVFAVANNQPVSINFLIREIPEAPLSLVIIFSVLLGALVSGLMIFLEKQKIKTPGENSAKEDVNGKENI
jgi:uncharacterized integral membrane protein